MSEPRQRAGVYLRISDDREGTELGVDRQLTDCRALARRERLTIVDTYRDNDLSASTSAAKPRPEYRRMLADAHAGKLDVIVAYSASRLTRRPREHEDLIDLAQSHGIRYLFVSSPSFDLNTADGQMVARMLVAADAAEAKRTAERVKRETRDRAERGRHHGGPRAYGITDKGTALVENEAARVRQWYATILAGGSISGVRKQLTRDGVLTPSWTTKKGECRGGRPWHDSSIRVVLLNERNAGVRELDGVEYPAPNPPIVPVTTFKAVRDILNNGGRKTNHDGAARKWLGAGLYLCQRCARPVRTSYDGTRGKTYRIYVCGTRDGGCGRSWKASPIDEWVTDLVAGILGREDARARLLPKPVKGIDTQALATEAAAIRANMTEVATDMVLARGTTRAALSEALSAGEARLRAIDAELVKAGRTDPLGPMLAAADPVAAWLAVEDVTRRQAVVRSLMRVELGAPLRGRVTWDAAKFITVTARGEQ